MNFQLWLPTVGAVAAIVTAVVLVIRTILEMRAKPFWETQATIDARWSKIETLIKEREQLVNADIDARWSKIDVLIKEQEHLTRAVDAIKLDNAFLLWDHQTKSTATRDLYCDLLTSLRNMTKCQSARVRQFSEGMSSSELQTWYERNEKFRVEFDRAIATAPLFISGDAQAVLDELDSTIDSSETAEAARKCVQGLLVAQRKLALTAKNHLAENPFKKPERPA